MRVCVCGENRERGRRREVEGKKGKKSERRNVAKEVVN